MEKNSRFNYVRELTGLRIVSMFVQEYMYWGWQAYDQENDDGIDGEIIIRGKDGSDLGCRIFVQIKSGPSYLKKEDDSSLYIQPYSDKEKVKNHIEKWNRQVEPIIVVYVNPEKMDSNGNPYEDIRNPRAWWQFMNNYHYDNSSYIKIEKQNTWGEHSKGALYKLVKPIIKDWNNYPEIEAFPQDKSLYYSSSLFREAKKYFEGWRDKETISTVFHHNPVIKITRIGWRHINNARRGERRRYNSLRLLSISERIIGLENVKPVLLQMKEYETNSLESFYGLRVRVNIGDENLKIQVVIRKWRNCNKDITKYWFYSVHIIK